MKIFDNHDNLLERQLFSYKRVSLNPASKIVKRYDSGSCKQKYIYAFSDTANLLKKTRIADRCNLLPYKKYTIIYDYNSNNKVVAKKIILKGKKVTWKRVYEYSHDIDLSTFYDVNDENKITAFYSRTYFWHKIARLNVKSYFE